MKSPGSLPDETLMALIAQGDERAFEVFYDRYKGLIYGLLVKMIGDKSAAEDVMLDVFSQIWKHAVAFQPQMASVKTWVTTIARRRAIDELRRRRFGSDQEVPQWAEVDASTLADPEELETRLEIHDLQSRVRVAMALLPSEQKEALALAYFKGYSHSRIAETLKQPLGSVKTRIRKAMQQLRETLNREL